MIEPGLASRLGNGLAILARWPFWDGAGWPSDCRRGEAASWRRTFGHRFDPNWLAGAYFGYGLAFVADEVAPVSQGFTDIGGDTIMRVGLQGSYTFDIESRFML